ncbi:hypothetical protein ILUMI_08091 [Ignelater luminosus]|uniref:Uncharacterized protein n=1 Tax=Ignelater luminosus TaxID=2038154 RepID=A0A8K0D530_IGNLU|nr:hypothetical protein ILUMI_08091 [Ignelater luminosus]
MLPDENLSDHKYIYFEVCGPKIEGTQEKTKTVDLRAFRMKVKRMQKRIRGNERVSHVICTEIIQRAYRNEIIRDAKGNKKPRTGGPKRLRSKEVLRLRLPQGARIIDFPNDLALVITTGGIEDIRETVNDSMKRIIELMERQRLSVIPEKSEALILNSSGRPNVIRFMIDEHDLGLYKTLKYLRVTFDRHGTCGPHVEMAARKAEEKATNLARIDNGGEEKRLAKSSALRRATKVGVRQLGKRKMFKMGGFPNSMGGSQSGTDPERAEYKMGTNRPLTGFMKRTG